MVRGVDSSKVAEWQGRLRRFAAGGLSVAEFCRHEGVSGPSFYSWRKRLRNHYASAGRPSFLPVRLTTAPSRPIVIGLPNGVRVRVPGDNLEALKAGIEAASALPGRPLAATGKEAPRC
jgi:transposase-like protein